MIVKNSEAQAPQMPHGASRGGPLLKKWKIESDQHGRVAVAAAKDLRMFIILLVESELGKSSGKPQRSVKYFPVFAVQTKSFPVYFPLTSSNQTIDNPTGPDIKNQR